MIRLILFLIIILVFSCKEQNTKLLTLNENDIIEVYNFSELEPLLNYKNDTTYIINFWATWCKPCIEELPLFEELLKIHKNKKVKITLVSLDMPDNLKSHLIPFVKNNSLVSQVILLDDPYENTWIPKVDKSWSGAIPATLIYNKRKRAFFEQSFTKEVLSKEISKFLKF